MGTDKPYLPRAVLVPFAFFVVLPRTGIPGYDITAAGTGNSAVVPFPPEVVVAMTEIPAVQGPGMGGPSRRDGDDGDLVRGGPRPDPGAGQRAALFRYELGAPRGALLYRPRSGHGLEEVSVGLMAYLDP